MATCNACKRPKRDDRFKACEKCREGWRLDKGLSYQRRTVPLDAHEAEVGKLREALKGATIVANHAGGRIKELEAAAQLAQRVLASLTDSTAIKTTTVINAYAQVREAELALRKVLAQPTLEGGE